MDLYVKLFDRNRSRRNQVVKLNSSQTNGKLSGFFIQKIYLYYIFYSCIKIKLCYIKVDEPEKRFLKIIQLFYSF